MGVANNTHNMFNFHLKTLYEVVGILPSELTPAVLSRQRRVCIARLHSDVTKKNDDLSKAKRALVEFACEILGDDQMRRKYDLLMARDYHENTVANVFTSWTSLNRFKEKITRTILIKPGSAYAKQNKQQQTTPNKQDIRMHARIVLSMIKNDHRCFCYILFHIVLICAWLS